MVDAGVIKKDVHQLINRGRIEEMVEVAGYTVQFRTLSGREDIEVLASVAHLTGTAQVAQMQIEMLGRAIKSINGVTLEALYVADPDGKPLDDVSVKRIAYIGALPLRLIVTLFEAYNKLTERVDQALGL